MSEDYFDVVKEERSLLEKVLTVFPGYRGYREKEVLRETNQIIRNTLFKNLKNVAELVKELYRDIMASQDRIEDAKKTEKLWMRIDASAERIKHAERGYTPLLNVLRVEKEQLLRLMKFDAGLAEEISNLRSKVEELRSKSQERDGFSAAILEVENALVRLENIFKMREEAMLGLYEVKEDG